MVSLYWVCYFRDLLNILRYEINATRDEMSINTPNAISVAKVTELAKDKRISPRLQSND